MVKCSQCEKPAVIHYLNLGIDLCIDHNLKLQQARQLEQNIISNLLNFSQTQGLISMGLLPPTYLPQLTMQSPFPDMR